MNISKILPSLEGRDEFKVNARGLYTVIDYVYALVDSFDDARRLDCRGIVFDSASGECLSRPLHKFFNIGEKKQASEIDWTRTHIVMNKLDGSMIHAAIIDGQVRFLTRGGITEHSLRAERHLTPDVERWCATIIDNGATPIFEWTAPENRIVIEYPDDKITLLAIREIESGKYMERSHVAGFASLMGVEIVEQFEMDFNKRDVNSIRELTGIEGVVVWFPETDEFYKIKTEEYVTMHRAVSYFDSEKAIFDLVMSGNVDDVKASLSDDRRKRLEEYSSSLLSELQTMANTLESIVSEKAELDQKSFALSIIEHPLKSILFSIRKGVTALDAVNLWAYKNVENLHTRW